LLDAKGIDRAVIGGLSMGGYVTMALLRRHRDRVSAVVLADTKASADPEQAKANRERIAQRVTDDGNTAVLLEETLPTLVGDTTKERRPLILGRVRAFVESAPPSAVAWAQRAMAARPDSFDVLRETDVPALVIVGEEDALSPLTDAQAMVEALPKGRLVTIPQAGHLSAVETPEEFTTALGDFLAGLPTA
jgi:pimeloyl-ACP methyl ester carboxylesterase